MSLAAVVALVIAVVFTAGVADAKGGGGGGGKPSGISSGKILVGQLLSGPRRHEERFRQE